MRMITKISSSLNQTVYIKCFYDAASSVVKLRPKRCTQYFRGLPDNAMKYNNIHITKITIKQKIYNIITLKTFNIYGSQIPTIVCVPTT